MFAPARYPPRPLVTAGIVRSVPRVGESGSSQSSGGVLSTEYAEGGDAHPTEDEYSLLTTPTHDLSTARLAVRRRNVRRASQQPGSPGRLTVMVCLTPIRISVGWWCTAMMNGRKERGRCRV